MEVANQNTPALPDIFDLLEETTRIVAEEMVPGGGWSYSRSSKRIGELMGQAISATPAPVTLDRLFEHIAVARGLHEASQRARIAGNPEWADSLHELGQLFLFYASGDVSAFRDTFVAAVAATSGETRH